MPKGGERIRASSGLLVFQGVRCFEQTIKPCRTSGMRTRENATGDSSSTDWTEEICRYLADKNFRIRHSSSIDITGAHGTSKRCIELCSALLSTVGRAPSRGAERVKAAQSSFQKPRRALFRQVD
jgi:hypothetical protein